MSEYQYFEWQVLDRPLSREEQVEVDKLSSHITVSARGAWVDYSWGDFKHDPLQVLADYFDAFLYMANWGSKQLAFRFPKALVARDALEPFMLADYVTLDAVGEWHVLDFNFDEAEPSDSWIEAEGWLSALAPMRNEILHGDYRALYLVWCWLVDLDGGIELGDGVAEPPVPPGLDKLTAAQQALIDWCGIDQRIVSAAVAADATVKAAPAFDYVAALRHLPQDERDNFLMRLLEDEPHLAAKLRQRLREG